MFPDFDHTHCIATGSCTRRLSWGRLHPWYDTANEHLNSLCTQYRNGNSPVLSCPDQSEIVEQASHLGRKIAQKFRHVLILGTGGSSLGAQALVATRTQPFPAIHFLDNLDECELQTIIQSVPLHECMILVISKSGNTLETMAQLIAIMDQLRQNGVSALHEHIMLISDPEASGVRNRLREFGRLHCLPVLDHPPEIGGRFSCFTIVGLLPAAIAGIDIQSVCDAATSVVECANRPPIDEHNSLTLGAAVHAAYQRELNSDQHVVVAYGARLSAFLSWQAQLWAESLGKSGQGSTPVPARGPIDQHSQFQLYLDGPDGKLFTIIRHSPDNPGYSLPGDLAREVGYPELANRRPADIVRAQAIASARSLIATNAPVRMLTLPDISAASLAHLMMHSILETLITGALLGIDPFGQPAVEAIKILTFEQLSK